MYELQQSCMDLLVYKALPTLQMSVAIYTYKLYLHFFYPSDFIWNFYMCISCLDGASNSCNITYVRYAFSCFTLMERLPVAI
mgnify:CR=1 FL=1